MKIKKCVITIAGFGTRMLPITKTVTKEMLPIVDVPTIFMQVKEAYLSGISEIIFVVSKRNINLIKDFFTHDHELLKEIQDDKGKLELLKDINKVINNMKFTYVIQKEKGTYGALWSARKYLENEVFALMYGDDLIDSDVPVLRQLIDEYEKTHDLVVAAKRFNYENLPKYGVIEYGDDNILKGICYKPNIQKSYDIIHGRFILNSNIFKVRNKLIYHNGELQLPGALLFLDEKVRVLLYDGIYFNIGSKIGYLKDNIYFGLKRCDMKDELLEYFDNFKK